MPVYRTTFAVDAPAARVWEALTALDRYPEWNPQIPRIRGSLRPGKRMILLQLALPGRPTMNLTATIEEARPGALLTWRGHVWPGGSLRATGASRSSRPSRAGARDPRRGRARRARAAVWSGVGGPRAGEPRRAERGAQGPRGGIVVIRRGCGIIGRGGPHEATISARRRGRAFGLGPGARSDLPIAALQSRLRS